MSRFYVTTPIYYVNSRPHIGHAYTTLMADILTRFHRLFGDESYFLTGTDEHGEKIAEMALAAGKEPQEFVDAVSAEFRDTWPTLHIHCDQFIRTTDPAHKTFVQKMLRQIHEAGHVYRDEYTGRYCVGCERYLDDNDLTPEGLCRDHLSAPAEVSEANYFFRMSAFQQQLIDHIEAHPEFIFPEGYRREVRGFLQQPLKDLCLSRPKKRLTWGVDLPFDGGFVTYVWFDALLNYVSALGGPGDPRFETWWPRVHHLLGKDIVKTHCIYWPCMLMALGIPLPQRFIVHGYWNMESSKISKSRGNAVSPLDLRERFGTDAVRYYLATAMSFGQDADFSEALFTERYNADLANVLGNLVSRTLTLTANNFEGCVPVGAVAERERILMGELDALREGMNAHVRDFKLHLAAGIPVQMGKAVNRYIDEHEPWKLAKDPTKRETLSRVLAMQCRAVKYIANAMEPVMPETTGRILGALSVDETTPTESAFDWQHPAAGQRLTPGAPLFPRVRPAATQG